MNLLAIIILLLISSLAGAMTFLFSLDYPPCPTQRRVSYCFLAAALLLAAWIGAAVHQQPRVLRTFIVDPTSSVLDSGVELQMISYLDQDDRLRLVNLGDEFRGSVPKGRKVKVTEFQRWWYCGISYLGMDSESLKPGYEIVR